MTRKPSIPGLSHRQGRNAKPSHPCPTHSVGVTNILFNCNLRRVRRPTESPTLLPSLFSPTYLCAGLLFSRQSLSLSIACETAVLGSAAKPKVRQVPALWFIHPHDPA